MSRQPTRTPQQSKEASSPRKDLPRPKATGSASSKSLSDNWKFYKNDIPSRPSPGTKIEDMLKWKGDYKKLEEHRYYIQWLFPIPGSKGINAHAQPLQKNEAKGIRENQALRDRVVRAYEMMLDFYGMKLSSRTHGTVERCDRNFEQRYKNLDGSESNYKRISRILVSLGHLGFERFQVPWVLFIIQEMEAFNNFHGVTKTTLTYWINSVSNEGDRNVLFERLCSDAKPSATLVEKVKKETTKESTEEIKNTTSNLADKDGIRLELEKGSESFAEDTDITVVYPHRQKEGTPCSVQ